MTQDQNNAVVVEEPLRVADAQAVDWSESADVVVVGFGGAGAVAALQANESGADVLIVERFGGGGATTYSAGIVYAGGTRFQRAGGYEDTADEMFKYLSIEVGDAVKSETLRRFCDDSEANIEWLVEHGVEFNSAVYKGKMTFPPEDKFLYFSGNEKIPAYAAKARPAPRGHRVFAPGWGGYRYYARLREAVERSKIRLKDHSRVERLVVDAFNRVIGVEVLALPAEADRAAHEALNKKINPQKAFGSKKAIKIVADIRALERAKGVRKFIRARSGVILTTGGFTHNVPMMRKHLPFLADHNSTLVKLGTAGCDGSGIQLGQSVGGEAGKMNRTFVGRSITPPTALVGGLMVNKRGERFVNEDIYNGLLGDAIMREPDGEAWLIIDSETFWKTLKQCIPSGDGSFKTYSLPMMMNLALGGTRKASSLAKLAEKCGFAPGALQRAVEESNQACATNAPDPVGKNAEYMRPMGKGPYRAVNCSISNMYSFTMFFTLGGLHVNEESGQVITPEGTPVEGLYAAGRAAIGVCSEGYFSGMSLADGLFAGRRAGRHVAMLSHNRAPVEPASVL